MIWILILFYSLFYFIIRKFIEKKYRIKELSEEMKKFYESSLKGKDISKLDEKALSKYYEFIQNFSKYYMTITIVSIVTFLVYIYMFSFSYNLDIKDNSTVISINNPILSYSTFYLVYNNTALGFYNSENGKIFIDKVIEDKKLLNLYIVVFKLPFNIPLLNKNWIGYIFTYIIFLLLIDLSYYLINRLKNKFIKSIHK